MLSLEMAAPLACCGHAMKETQMIDSLETVETVAHE